MSRYDIDKQPQSLAELEPLILAAQAELSAICNGKRFRMSIPVDDADSDMVIGDALRHSLAFVRAALPPSSPVADSPTPEICICAAIQMDNGIVLRGHRHDDCLNTALKYGYKERITQAKQGFITSHNRFVGREEGAELQRAAGIVSAHTGQFTDFLFSEDLYFNDNAASAPSPSAGAITHCCLQLGDRTTACGLPITEKLVPGFEATCASCRAAYDNL